LLTFMAEVGGEECGQWKKEGEGKKREMVGNEQEREGLFVVEGDQRQRTETTRREIGRKRKKKRKKERRRDSRKESGRRQGRSWSWDGEGRGDGWREGDGRDGCGMDVNE